MDGKDRNVAQNISYIINDTKRIGMQILFDRISSATFHNAHHRSNEVNPTIVREWIQKWTPRLKTLSISDLSSIPALQAEPHHPEQIIADVFTWLSDRSSPCPIMWIHHQDRSQTSFFAHVIAELLDELGKLSGSFFCTEVDGDIDITDIIPTLAFQLAQNIPGTQSLIAEMVVQNPSIFKLQAKSQIKKLILNPLLSASQSGNLDTGGIPNVFFIHGLEEFDDADRFQLSFLYAFSDALTQLATEVIPYRLVLIGRDSSYINNCLSNTDLRQRVLDRSIAVPASLGEEEENREKKREAKKKGEKEEDREKKREAKKKGEKKEDRERKRKAKDVPWHLMNTLRGHTSTVTAVAFSTDGTTLASVSLDKTVRLWECKTGSLVATLEGHSGHVYDVAFSPDGSRLASGSSDATVRLWNVKSKSLIATLQGHSTTVYSVAFSPDGSRIVSGSHDNAARLWHGKTGSLVAILEGHTDIVQVFAFSADGLILATGSYDHTVRLWDGKGGGLIATLQGHYQRIMAVAFSPHGSRLASGCEDKTVRLWDAKTGILVTTLYGHSCDVKSVVFSPDGSILASGASDKTVRLWDVKTGSLITVLEGHSDSVQSVSFSPDGSMLASGSYDKTLRLWDVKTGSFIIALDGYHAWMQTIAFSSNGLSLAFPSPDYTIQIWH